MESSLQTQTLRELILLDSSKCQVLGKWNVEVITINKTERDCHSKRNRKENNFTISQGDSYHSEVSP